MLQTNMKTELLSKARRRKKACIIIITIIAGLVRDDILHNSENFLIKVCGNVFLFIIFIIILYESERAAVSLCRE
jgi:nicotinamide riboside transporter PnuC